MCQTHNHEILLNVALQPGLAGKALVFGDAFEGVMGTAQGPTGLTQRLWVPEDGERREYLRLEDSANAIDLIAICA